MKLQLETIKKLVPKGTRTMITQEFLDKIEACVSNSMIAEQFKENFVTYLSVLQTGKYKMDDYINAVTFVTHKLLGRSNIDSYAATFPNRFQRLKDEGQDQIDAFASMYSKNKLVMQIFEQTLVPTYVLNAPLHQEALTEAAKMLKDPNVRGMVRVKVIDTILQYTKAPEVIENKLTIGIEQQSTIADLREVTENLAEMYKISLEKGYKSLKELTEANIIDTEYEEV